jgi:NADPH2:quinone reductase
MRAARCHAYDGIDAVTVDDLPAPDVAPGEVRVAVRAAAINFPDLLMIEDKYQISHAVPFTLGSELSGVVEEVAPDVTTVAPGDHVVGATAVGAFAEEIVLGAGALQRIPDGVDVSTAAAFGVAHETAWHSLRSVAEVQPGEWVVVLGAAGGVGLAAVEIAHHCGAHVVAAAAGADRLAVCESRGAEALVDYRSEDLKVRTKEVTGGGADVVIDPVGGSYAEAALRAMRRGGRFVTVGYASGEIPRIPLNLVLLKGVTIMGFEMGSFIFRETDEFMRGRAELLDLLATGALRPHVGATFGLDDVGDALRAVAARQTTGKVLITPS